MNKKLFLLLVLPVWISTGLSAQTAGILTLEAVIQQATTESPQALAARKSIEGSRYEYASFKAGLKPRLSLVSNNSGYTRAINPITQNDGTVDFFLQQQGTINTALQLSQTLPLTGGQLFASSSLTRLYVFNDASWNSSWNASVVNIGFSQPLNQFNPLRWDNRIRPLQWKIASQAYAQEMENVAVTTSGLFFDALLASVNLENARFNEVVNDSIYFVSKGRFAVGKIAENELLQSELAFMNSRIATANAVLEYQRALQALFIQLGREESAENVRFVPPSEAPIVTVDVDFAVEQARKNNSRFLSFDLQALQRKRDLDQAARRNGFQADLSAVYGLNQTGTGLTEAYSNPTNRQVVGVGFNVPIVNWGQQRADIKAAKARQQELEYSNSLQQERLALDVAFRVRVFNQLKDQLAVAAKSDTIAQRRYEVTKNRYLIGKVDITNLQIAQNEKDSARQGFIRTLRQCWTAWYELRQLTLYDFREGAPVVYRIAE